MSKFYLDCQQSQAELILDANEVEKTVKKKNIHVHGKQYTASFILHSFSNLSDDRSNASSKTMPPHSEI